MIWYETVYEILGFNLIAIILELGLAIYIYRTFHLLKGGILTRGMLLLVGSPIFMILSAIFDTLSELGYGGIFELAHDLCRITFILFLFLGFRSIFTAWTKFTK